MDYEPWDSCYQTWKSFIKTVCPKCSKMEILFKLKPYREGKHHKSLDNLKCLEAVLKYIEDGRYE